MSVQLGETAWNADSANAGQVGCDGENVGEIHLQWIRDAFAQRECRYGRSRRDQSIDVFENPREILPNQLAHFLRAQVIGVVITGAQNVSAKNDSPFHFRSETPLTGATVKIEYVFRIFSTVSVTPAIEASEVRGSFSGGNNVVNRDRVFSAGQ